MKRRPPPEVCPVCGEDVPRNAAACRECGADYRSGWREDADLDGLGIEDEDDFDYEDFVAREFGGGAPPKGIGWVWWTAGVVVLVAFFLFMVLRF